MHGQCDKLVTVIGHQFITLTIHNCVQNGGREAPRRVGLSAAAETCYTFMSLRENDNMKEVAANGNRKQIKAVCPVSLHSKL